MKLNLPLIASLVSALAGVVGTVLVPTAGHSLAAAVQGVLAAIAGLLMVIPAAHASNVAAHTARLRATGRQNAGLL